MRIAVDVEQAKSKVSALKNSVLFNMLDSVPFGSLFKLIHDINILIYILINKFILKFKIIKLLNINKILFSILLKLKY